MWKFWYSHVYKQMLTKKPFGHIIIPDKVDLGLKDRKELIDLVKSRLG